MACLGGLMLVCALAVISERNPVHSVFFLVLTFCQSAALLVVRGAEFMAMMFLVVYVGAIAILFLFVVMMLSTQADRVHTPWIPLGTGLSFILLIQMIGLSPTPALDIPLGLSSVMSGLAEGGPAPLDPTVVLGSVSNMEALGLYLYTTGVPYFMAAAVILLVSMIGAIALTLHRRDHVKRQDIALQVARTAQHALILHSNVSLLHPASSATSSSSTPSSPAA